MKNRTIIFFSLSVFLVCCTVRKNDTYYFNGEIKAVDDIVAISEMPEPDTVRLNGAYYGFIAAYDSLMIFWNASPGSDFSFDIFDMNNGNPVGSFCRKGRGEYEFINLLPIFQLYLENGQLKTVLRAANEEKSMIWNISESVSNGATVYDTIIPYKEKLIGSELFCHGGNIYSYLLPYGNLISDPDFYELPYLKRYDRHNMETPDYIMDLFKTTVKGKTTDRIKTDAFLRSHCAIKPDGTKMAMGMSFMPQLNIIDLEKWNQTGYRIGKNEEGFSRFLKEKDDREYYCTAIQADDDYIYMLYFGDLYSEIKRSLDIIYIFDWNGNPVEKLRLKSPAAGFWLDAANDCIYTFTWNDTNILRYDLSELGLRGL